MILFPSNTNDTHFGGFSVRSRSWQALEISFRASAWSAGEDEMIVRSSANPNLAWFRTTCRGTSYYGIVRWSKPFVHSACGFPFQVCQFDHFSQVPFAVLEASRSVTLNRDDFCKIPSRRLVGIWFIPESLEIGVDLGHLGRGIWQP